MNKPFGILSGSGLLRADLRQMRAKAQWVLPLIALTLLVLSGPMMHAQTTAQMTGTVQDPSGGVIPGAGLTRFGVMVRGWLGVLLAGTYNSNREFGALEKRAFPDEFMDPRFYHSVPE